MAVLFHGTYGDHFSPLYVFFGVEQASEQNSNVLNIWIGKRQRSVAEMV